MRNIFLVTGPIGGGKTEFIHHLQGVFRREGVSVAPDIVSDSKLLTDIVKWDHDNFGGIYHVHQKGETPHPHEYQPDTEHETFFCVNPIMQSELRRRLFTTIEQETQSNTLVIAELAAGADSEEKRLTEPHHDYSYDTITRELEQGKLPVQWIERIACIAHVRSKFDLRRALNTGRLDNGFVPGDDVSGIKSRHVPDEVLSFTTEDDFFVFHDYLNSEHKLCERIVPVRNDGTLDSLRRAEGLVLNNLRDHGYIEGNRYGKEIR